MAVVYLTASMRSHLSSMVSYQVKASFGMNVHDWSI